MPDRAVVDRESPCPATKDGIWPHNWGHASDDGWSECHSCGLRVWHEQDVRDPALIERDRLAHEQFLRAQQPRAIVALSENGKWLVVLRDGQFQRYGRYFSDYRPMGEPVPDTGQDARDVLKAFLERTTP